MTLSTSSPSGVVSARTVLMKVNDGEKLLFESENFSRKGRELAANSRAAMTIYWKEVHRQVALTGRAEVLPDEVSDERWRLRGRPNQAASAATREGATLASLAEELELHDKVDALANSPGDIPRPESYRAYGLYPDVIEFWEGSDTRLHRRVLYEKTPTGAWQWRRLQP